MKTWFAVAASLAALCACGLTTATTETPTMAEACNTVETNTAVAAQMRGNAAPSASLPALAGGAMQGGIYDLAGGGQFDGAPSWEEARHVSVLVTAAHEGTVLDWAERSGEVTTRWTAAVSSEPTALTFTCGRNGTVPIDYASGAGELHLRMPDPSGVGMLDLVFVQRGD